MWSRSPGNPVLTGKEVHVWRAALDQPGARLLSLYESLSADERERATRFHFEKDRRQFIAARGLLRRILSLYLKAEPSRLQFSYTAYGKPSLTAEFGDNPLRFNVSHSGELALLAFSRGRELGVDIECIRPELADEQIAERFFSSREVAALRALPAPVQKEAFFTCWTRKEAYIKAIGEGLSLPLHSFDVSLSPTEPAALLAVRANVPEATRWTLRALEPGPDYKAALVAEGNDWELKCWQWIA